MSAFAVASDQNAPHKKANQDAAISAIFRNKAGVAIRLVAVADGISNSYRGELAAKHTILTLGRMLEGSVLKNARELTDIAEQKVVREINRQLLEINDGTVCSKTTLTAVVFFPEDNCIIHLGDTRAFAVGKKGKYCISLTEDHNPAQGKDRQMQRAGIHRFLGDEWDAWKPDVIYNHKDIDDDTSLIFVTCDGVHDFLNEDLLLGMLNQCNGDVSLFCKRAVAQAKVMWSPKGKANGDNITMAALDLHSDEDEKIPTAVFGGAAEGESPSNPASEKARLTQEIASKIPDSGAKAKPASKTSNPKKSGRPAWWWPTLIGFNALIVLSMVFLVIFLGRKDEAGNGDQIDEVTTKNGEEIGKQQGQAEKEEGTKEQTFKIVLDRSIKTETVRFSGRGLKTQELKHSGELSVPHKIVELYQDGDIKAEIVSTVEARDERMLDIELNTDYSEIVVIPVENNQGDLSNDSYEVPFLAELSPEPQDPEAGDDWKSIPIEKDDNYVKIAGKVLAEIYGGSYREAQVASMIDLLRQKYRDDQNLNDDVPEDYIRAGDPINVPASKDAYLKLIGK